MFYGLGYSLNHSSVYVFSFSEIVLIFRSNWIVCVFLNLENEKKICQKATRKSKKSTENIERKQKCQVSFSSWLFPTFEVRACVYVGQYRHSAGGPSWKADL